MSLSQIADSFAEFTEETEIVVPWHRRVMVNLSTGKHEVIWEGIPSRSSLAAEAVRNTAGQIQLRTLDAQTAEKAKEFFEQHKAERQIDRARDEEGKL